jgi:hypothetical protein
MTSKLLPLTVCIISLFMLSAIVIAQPGGIPHQFKGAVTVNGGPAPDGLVISARMGGFDVASTTTFNGGYGRIPCKQGYVPTCIFYIDDPNGGSAGRTIDFFISNTNVGSYVLNYGASTELDFSLDQDLGICGDNLCSSGETCSTCAGDCGTCPTNTNTNTGTSGSSSGSTSGSGGIPPQTGEEDCEEDWSCSEWSICSVDGKQFRSCTDSNNCGTNEEEPVEEKTCTYSAAETPKICPEGTKVCLNDDLMECPDGTYWNLIESCEFGCGGDAEAAACKNADGSVAGQSTDLVGMLIGNPTAMYGILIVVVIILAGTVYWKMYWKKKR